MPYKLILNPICTALVLLCLFILSACGDSSSGPTPSPENTPATIGGTDAGSVQEDVDVVVNNISTTGVLTITDADAGEASFLAETIVGSYGSLDIQTDGNWSYIADNTLATIQQLNQGQSETDSFTVFSVDNTNHDVVITINGRDEAVGNTPAVIGGTDSGTIQEDVDVIGNNLSTSGTLSITDVDAGEASFTAETIVGSYGSLDIQTDGSWSYTADNNQIAIQNLNQGETLTDTLTVSSVDNTTHDVVITINGSDEATGNTPAVIGGVDIGTVQEDVAVDSNNNLITSGTLTITDVDAGEAGFIAETIDDNYGSLVIQTNGNWSYTADNTQIAIQNLNQGQSLIDILTVASVDGTTHNVLITINGSDDGGSSAPLIYDIVYIRFPIAAAADGTVGIPAGETAYTLQSAADLMLLKPDGGETVLVDCADNCSVMDPFISYDGQTVYYSHNELLSGLPYGPFSDNYTSWISKIHLEGHPDFNNYAPIRLTYNDGFDSVQYQANRDSNGNIKTGHDQSSWRAMRDMAPVPLADGRLLFTSNRSALTAFHPGTDAVSKGSIQQLYVMDDHDGTANTKALANIQLLETGNIHMVQHPMQLKDGRILFSTWQDAGTKTDISASLYAMTSLFTVHPDGSNLQQFTEPHDHHKNVDHFISQLSDEQVVWAQYYPHLEGFGIILRAPVSTNGQDFLRGSATQTLATGDSLQFSFREFDRVGTVSLTPHTDSGDTPAPDLSGKYSMPSAVNNGGLLVAYSTGSVNQTDFACSPSGQCESLKSGIYMIPDATGDENDFILNPATQLIKIKDDLNYNEIWPRAVLSYQQIYGQAKPDIINNLATSMPDDVHLEPGEAKALLGTSSIYNREPLNEGDPDPFNSGTSFREGNSGNWTIQGAEAGVFTNNDIHGVRIITTPPKPYTKPINKFSDASRWNTISRHIHDDRLEYVVARYGSDHGERWEILGEFPVKKPVPDGQGNPDTSWLAKIPADTPTFIQTIDDKGMTLVSEIAWRALKSGEKRADCGGCHAHSMDVIPLDFATTEAGKNKPIENIVGVAANDVRVKDGIWDLTLNAIPLLNDTGVRFEPGYSYGVEFNRDITPILNNRCVSCHQAGQSGAALILNDDPWAAISRTGGYNDNALQISKYIRTPQARQSLLVWATWGERLDGRSNETRADDIDFAGHPDIPGITDEDKRTIARWVDLGSPMDFPNTDGMGYTDDYQLPVVNIYTPHLGDNTATELKVGFADAKSGINYSSLKVTYRAVDSSTETAIVTSTNAADYPKNILSTALGLGSGEYILTVSVQDTTGNIGIATRRFTIQ